MDDASRQTATDALVARVTASFHRQAFMATIGAQIGAIAPGQVTVILPYRPQITQQHGFFHGGVIATLADTAAGYAAFSLFDPQDSVLTVEFKMNIMAPGQGERLVAEAAVIRSGRTLTVVQTDVWAEAGGDRRHCALMTATMMRMAGKSDHPPP